MRRHATYGCLTRAAILAAMAWAALSPGAQAGHGSPAGDAVAARITTVGVAVEVPTGGVVNVAAAPASPPQSNAEPEPASPPPAEKPETTAQPEPEVGPAPAAAAPAALEHAPLEPAAPVPAAEAPARAKPAVHRRHAAAAPPPRRKPPAHAAPAPPWTPTRHARTPLPATGGTPLARPPAAAAGPDAAARLLVTLILFALISITLRARFAERRLSTLLWSSSVHPHG